ncbi:hypothetical protein E2C01_030341 [Portunus trituberculatus]|uniref:Uncharacterized protein n=1 Tax=Portunus trituberculatus TaxID=210409 RepID=A0A5B7EVG4_PORTR|nr:hypothetical protein [Portunus trituberculatus]
MSISGEKVKRRRATSKRSKMLKSKTREKNVRGRRRTCTSKRSKNDPKLRLRVSEKEDHKNLSKRRSSRARRSPRSHTKHEKLTARNRKGEAKHYHDSGKRRRGTRKPEDDEHHESRKRRRDTRTSEDDSLALNSSGHLPSSVTGKMEDPSEMSEKQISIKASSSRCILARLADAAQARKVARDTKHKDMMKKVL